MDQDIPVQPVQENSPAQFSIQKKSGSSRRMFWIFFVVSILIAFTTGGYFLGAGQGNLIVQKQKTLTVAQSVPTPTPDPTSNWKKYTNSKYGIQFKYPPTFSLINIVDGKSIAAFTDKSNAKQRLSTLPDISLRIIPIVSGGDYKNKLIEDVVFAGSGLHPKSFSEFSSKIIGGNTVYYIKTGLSEGILSLNYYLVDKNNIVVFALISSPVDWTNPNFNFENDSLNQNLQQILSSVKFTDQNQTADVSADSFIQSYYNSYLSCLINYYKDAGSSPNKSLVETCPYNANNALTQDLSSQIEKNHAKDPEREILCLAQDYPNIPLTFNKAVISNDDTATAVVHTLWGDPASPIINNINVGLQKVDNQWKISSITCIR